MADDEIGIVQLNVERRLRQERPAESAGNEQGNKADGEQHRRGEPYLPPHSVPSQLKVLMAEGTPMHMVRMEKANAEYGLIPLMNMWWPHTMKPRNPIASMAYTMAL